jgi:hypothetical protein
MKLLSIVLLTLSLIFLGLNFVDYNINEDHNKVAIHEKFDPALERLNTMAKLEFYVDSVAATKNINPGTIEYALTAKEIVSQRFYHKYATKDLNENWIAAVAEKVTGLCLATNFTSDDILKKPYGYCVQVNTVLMELLLRKKCDYRIVSFPHHFTFISHINNKWYYFDPDQEPEINLQSRCKESWLKNEDSLVVAYRKDKNEIAARFGNPVNYSLSAINQTPAVHAKKFQYITFILSKIAFIFPLVWCVYLNGKKTIYWYLPPLKVNNLKPALPSLR